MQRFHNNYEPGEHRRNRRFQLVLLSLSAVFSLLIFDVSRADASCGDYLSHGRESQGEAMSHDELPTTANHSSEHAPHRRPCHGPSCQQAPLQAPLSVPVVQVNPQDRWGWVASIVLLAPEYISSLAFSSEPANVPMIAFRLDRPPKA